MTEEKSLVEFSSAETAGGMNPGASGTSETFEEMKKKEPRALCVWVLDKDMATVYPAYVFDTVCPECGKRRLNIVRYSGSEIPLKHLKDNAVIFVPPKQYKSGLSWENCPGFFSRKVDLKFVTVPRRLASTLFLPSTSWVTVYSEVRAVYTENDIAEMFLTFPKKKRICFQCLLKKLPEPEYEQGNLRIWKVKNDKNDPTYIFARKVEALGVKETEIFNHRIKGSEFYFYLRDSTKGWLLAHKPVVIISGDHSDLQLPEGEYIMYHPVPCGGD